MTKNIVYVYVYVYFFYIFEIRYPNNGLPKFILTKNSSHTLPITYPSTTSNGECSQIRTLGKS